MNMQVEKLERLLQRVQRNRQTSRADAAPAAAHALPVPPMVDARRIAAPSAEAPRAQERQSVVEPRPSQQQQRAPERQSVVEARPSQPRAPERQSVVEVMPTQQQPRGGSPQARPERVVLAESQVKQPSRSIAQLVGKSPAIAAASFGELLRRSLSLRPR